MDINPAGACKAVVLPLVAATELDEQEGGYRNGSNVNFYIASTLSLIFMILAGYLAWTCSANETIGMKILYTLLAIIFNVFYLIYYLIYRVIMGNACP